MRATHQRNFVMLREVQASTNEEDAIYRRSKANKKQQQKVNRQHQHI